ncbi:MAG: NAD-binding protein [Rhodospirillales bacterium]|nr:NAD-binding protein [Rhodospirillales bacterium]
MESYTATRFHLEKAGDSSKMKFLANYLVFVHTVAAAECMVLEQKAGLDPELILSALQDGAGASRMLELRGGMMTKSDYRGGGGGMFDVFLKDASIITDFAEGLDIPLDLLTVTRAKLDKAITQGLDHLDIASVCKALETEAGIERALAE